MPLSPTLLLPTPKPTLTRTQLLAKLDHYAHQHLTVLNAKRGFGKRSIIDDWITSRALTCLSFDFTEPPNALSTNEPLNQTDRLWQTLTSQAQNILNIAHTAPTLKGFCNAIQNHLPPIENKEATTAPSTPSTPSEKKRIVIILHGYQLSTHETDTQLLECIHSIGSHLGIIIITEHTPPQALVPLYTTKHTLFLSENELKFNRCEIGELIRQYMNVLLNKDPLKDADAGAGASGTLTSLLHQQLVDLLYDQLGGWPDLVQHCLSGLINEPILSKLIAAQSEDPHDRHNSLHISEQRAEYLDALTKTVIALAIDRLDHHLITPQNSALLKACSNTAGLPKISPSLTAYLRDKRVMINSGVMTTFNQLQKSKFMVFSRGQHAELIDSHPILEQYRLSQCSNDASDDRLHAACQWYLTHNRAPSALHVYKNFQIWPSFFDVLEKSFDHLLRCGNWHVLKPILNTLPLSQLKGPLTRHPALSTNIALCALLNQELPLFFRLLLHTLPQNNPDLSQCSKTDQIQIEYLQQVADNVKKSSQRTHSTFVHLLPDYSNRETTAELRLLESYRQIYCEKDLEAALDAVADALELAMDQESTFLVFHCLMHYVYLMEHIGEIKSILQCCNMLNAWAQSRYYCGFPLPNIIQMLTASYSIERNTINSVRSETSYLTASVSHTDIAEDTLLEFLFYRTLATLYKVTLADSLSAIQMEHLTGLTPMLSMEFLSLANPLNSAFISTHTLISDPTSMFNMPRSLRSPLPPLNLHSALFQLIANGEDKKETKNKKNREAANNTKTVYSKAMMSELKEIESVALDRSQHPVAIAAKLTIASQHLKHNADEEASIKTQEALEIINITGHLKTFKNIGSSLMSLLPKISSDNPPLTPLINTLIELDHSEPKQKGHNSSSQKDIKVSLLSKREKEVITLVVKGMSNEEIASHLSRSVGTIKLHIHKAYKKLEVKNRMEAIKAFRDLLMTDPPKP